MKRISPPYLRAWHESEKQKTASGYYRKTADSGLLIVEVIFLAAAVAILLSAYVYERRMQANYRSLPSADEVVIHSKVVDWQVEQERAISREYGKIAGNPK